MEYRISEERFVEGTVSPSLHGTKSMVSVKTLTVQLLSLSLSLSSRVFMDK